MVGNKDDLYSEEEVSYKEGLELAKEINDIYQRTSAKYESGGIDVLFENIAKKLSDSGETIINTIEEGENKLKGEKLLKEKIKKGNKIKRCC